MKNKIIILACLMPVFLLLGFTTRYCVNAIHADAWNDELPMIAHSLDGTLKFDDLWKQHAEHRLFFPRLIMLRLAHLTNFNTNAEVAVEILLAAVTLFNLFMICKQTKCNPWLLPFASLLLFTPMAWEVWLCGYMLHYWLPIACFTAIPWMVVYRWRMFTVTIVCLVATFSIAAGFLSWIIALPLLWVNTPEKKRTDVGAIGCIGLVAMGAYFRDFQWNPPLTGLMDERTGMMVALNNPTKALWHFLSYFGNGLATTSNGMHGVGLGLFIIFIICFLAAAHKKMLTKLLPWFCIAFIPIACAAMTTSNRLYYDLIQVPRYIPFAVLFIIALVFISSKVFDFIWAGGLVTGLTIMNLLAVAQVSPQWANKSKLIRYNLYLTRLVDVVSHEQLAPAFQNAIIVRIESPEETFSQIKTLGKHGYIKLVKPEDPVEQFK